MTEQEKSKILWKTALYSIIIPFVIAISIWVIMAQIDSSNETGNNIGFFLITAFILTTVGGIRKTIRLSNLLNKPENER